MPEMLELILRDLLLFSLFIGLVVRRRALTPRWFGLILGLLVAVALLDTALTAVRLWNAYADDPVGQYYLPPYSTIVFDRIWRLIQPILVQLGVAGAVFGVLALARVRWRLEQYGPEDVAFLTLAAFVSGWPGFFLTFIAIFLVSAVGSIVLRIHSTRSRTHPRSRSLSFGGEDSLDSARDRQSSPTRMGAREKGASDEAQPIRLIITPFILPVTSLIIWFLPWIAHVTTLDTIRF